MTSAREKFQENFWRVFFLACLGVYVSFCQKSAGEQKALMPRVVEDERDSSVHSECFSPATPGPISGLPALAPVSWPSANSSWPLTKTNLTPCDSCAGSV